MQQNNEFERYQKAQKKVKAIKGFFSNLISYILVISFLAFINLRYSPKHLWFLYPMLGWGLGVFIQAMKVFEFSPFFNKSWEEKRLSSLWMKKKMRAIHINKKMMREDIKYYKAKKRVENIKGFYGHLVSYIVINLVLYLVNYITYPNDFWFDHWFYWQLLIWGVGLIVHGIVVFYSLPIFGQAWEERKIQEFMQEEQQHQNNKFE